MNHRKDKIKNMINKNVNYIMKGRTLIERIPFHYTMVTYPADRNYLVGQFMALLSLFPIFSVVALTTLSLAAGAEQMTAFASLLGVLSNETVNYLIKEAWAQPRPPGRSCSSIDRYFCRN